MLTNRGEKYLATLERVSSVPTREVERILADNEYPCLQEWLDFHERFSGYVESFGQDRAVWGLAHESPLWMDAFSVELEYDKRDGVFEIACADVHPSYNYFLRDSGEFLGFPSESFEIYVERKSVGYFFSKEGRVKPVRESDIEGDVLRKILNEENVVVEATDKFFVYYMNDSFLCVRNVETSSINGWARI